MDAKLNHSDLSALFAQKANISGNKAEAFTKALFDLIIEGLEKEGVVKINGLGTFKITDVASRSSVNVNTGEKFEIKGHKKLTFTPAESLKEIVNQPFAIFEPVEVDDSYQEEEEESRDYDSEPETLAAEEPGMSQTKVEEEIPATVEELHYTPITEIEEEMPAEEEATLPVPAPQPAIEEEMPAKEEEPVATEKEDTKPASAHQPAIKEETPTIEKEAVTEDKAITKPAPALQTEIKEEVPAVKEAPVVTEEEATKPFVATSEPPKENKAPERKVKKGSKAPFIILLVIAIAAIGGFIFFSGEKGSEKSAVTVAAEEKNTPSTESTAEEVAVPAQPVEEEPYEFVITEELAAINLRDISLADTTLYVSSGELTTHIVAADETLTKIALKYFGDKKLWPYIVKYNNLAKPDDLCKGMEIVIPKLKPAR